MGRLGQRRSAGTPMSRSTLKRQRATAAATAMASFVSCRHANSAGIAGPAFGPRLEIASVAFCRNGADELVNVIRNSDRAGLEAGPSSLNPVFASWWRTVGSGTSASIGALAWNTPGSFLPRADNFLNKLGE